MRKGKCVALRHSKSQMVKVSSMFLDPCDFFLITLLYIEHFSERQADNTLHPTVSIQVEPDEEAHTYPGGRTQSWTPYAAYSRRSIPSQNASGQYLASYRFLSLVSPLLAAISDAIDVANASTFTVHRLRHLLDVIITLRPDASLNVL